MRIAICDDQDIFLLKLKQYLEDYYKSIDVIIDTFKSGEEFLKKYNSKYELIFLDIEMGKLNGIETAKKLRESNKDVIIIFLTSHIEFATDGYEVNAFRFLLKPVDENKLKIALQDIEKEISNNKKILIKDKDNEILLKHKDIVYIEAQNINVSICTMNDKCFYWLLFSGCSYVKEKGAHKGIIFMLSCNGNFSILIYSGFNCFSYHN